MAVCSLSSARNVDFTDCDVSSERTVPTPQDQMTQIILSPSSLECGGLYQYSV